MIRDHKAPRDRKEIKALPVPRDRREIKALPDRQALLDRQDRQALPDDR